MSTKRKTTKAPAKSKANQTAQKRRAAPPSAGPQRARPTPAPGPDAPPPVNPNPRAGNGGTVPPVSNQFRPGNPGGPGRPKTVGQLRDYIQSLGGEEVGTEKSGAIITRLDLMLRSMFVSKNASDKENILKYGWGTVAQKTQEYTFIDEIAELLVMGKITEAEIMAEVPEYAERIIATANLRRNESGPIAGPGRGEG